MTNLSIENLLCCPICKNRLTFDSELFSCAFCGEKFTKNKNIYDFQIRVDDQDRNHKEKFEQLILNNKSSKWFTQIFNYLSPVEYFEALLDPHLKEINEYNKKFIAEGINIGERYDNLIFHQSKNDLHIISAMRYISKIKNKNIALDVGCGTLRVTKALLKMGFKQVIAIDFLPELMSYGYEKLSDEDKKRVFLVKADVRFLPFQESSIDLIFALELFEHINAPKLMLLDLKRILNNNGIGIMNTWNASEIRHRKIIKQEGKSYYKNGFFYKLYELKELKKILKEVNVDFSVRLHGIYFGAYLSNLLGNGFAKIISLLDYLFSFFLPKFLFHYLLFVFKKENIVYKK